MPSATYIWSKVLGFIEQHHTEAMVQTWFDDVDVVELRDDTLVLFTPNEFRKEILETRCISIIQEAMLKVANQKVQVQILGTEERKAYTSGPAVQDELDPIMRDYTFDNFVVGPSNNFAHAAALSVVNAPGDAYNPLLIYGDSGLGKTHLLYAIANAIREQHLHDPTPFHIVYVKGDQFSNELIEAIGQGVTANIEFRNKYRTADLFLMDDIQFIAGKNSTQEEFFHTFNTLFEGKKQIILTSDRPPEKMSTLENRLKTRFQQGLMADIQAPDYETRVAIIQKKADSIGLQLPPDVVTYIAENITTNVRQLEGTVKKLLVYRDLDQNPINLTNVSRAIKDMFKDDPSSILPTPQLIIAEVSSYYNIAESVIRGTARNKTTSEARQVAMYLISKLCHLSQELIAQEFGKDHTTVLYALRKIESGIRTSRHLQQVVGDIEANINGKLS